MFFSFDGIDGVGKSTQADLFAGWLRQQDLDVVQCRDPGSTPLGERLRKIVLGDEQLPVSRLSEMLLYMAARAQLVADVIRPALDAGKTVVSDRYVLANIAYQGYGGGLDVESVRTVGNVATGGIKPDMIFLLDMSVEQALGRIRRAHDRMEAQGQAYLQRVREGFLAEARQRPDQIVVINAARAVDQIQQEIRTAAAPLLTQQPRADLPEQS